MTTDSLLIDCDGHILEPPDLWERYLEPAYRDRALRLRVDPDDGYEYVEIDTRRAKLTRPGTLGTLGGMGKQVDEATQLRQRAMRGEIRPEEVRAQQAERKRETRRKILAGAMVLDRLARGDLAEKLFMADMDRFLERDQDRELFGLPPKAPHREDL